METSINFFLFVITAFLAINLFITLRNAYHINALSSIFTYKAELLIGSPAPSFSAVTPDDQTITLRHLRGQEVVLIFMSPECKPCIQKLPELHRLASLARKQNIEFVLVSEDDKQKTEDMMHDHDVTLPLILAPRLSNQFARTYNPRGITPYFCHLDEKAVVRNRGSLREKKWHKLAQSWHSQSVEQVDSPS